MAYRIDGGAGLGDFAGLIRSLTEALRATLDRSEKFERFAGKVLRDKAVDTKTGAESRETLRLQLRSVIERLAGYSSRNFPPRRSGGSTAGLTLSTPRSTRSLPPRRPGGVTDLFHDERPGCQRPDEHSLPLGYPPARPGLLERLIL